MKLLVKKPVEIEVLAINLKCHISHGDEEIPYVFPHRKDDEWDVTIDLETNAIRQWPKMNADVHIKVVDMGTYTLLGKDDCELAAIENDYVPSCIPGDYGDYVVFSIDDTGKISPEIDTGLIYENFFERED